MPARSALTLIELLVVIAILATCIAFLLPAVHSSRQAAYRTECASNMRQNVIGLRSQHRDLVLLPPQAQEERLLQARLARLCPLDPQHQERLELSGTSYVRSSPTCDSHSPLMTSKTIVLFEASVDLTSEAFDPCAWFEAPDASVDAIFSAMQRSLALQQHGDVANYAYADGHVCAISVSAVRAWAEDRFNFALRNRGEYRDRS